MPELPDITVYAESLAAKAHGRTLQRVRLGSPFLLRTALPPIAVVEGRGVVGIERLGKRVVIALDGGLFLVIHLMIAGRLHWHPAGAKAPAKSTLARFDFDDGGTLALTEAGSQRRAALHLVEGRAALQAMDPGGIDVLSCSGAEFAQRLTAQNHTLKRALTNPQLFSGIGNAYADEIAHRARLSPLTLTRRLDAASVQRLLDAARTVLTEWTARLRDEAAAHGGWPRKVTAFHPQMAVHGRYGKPCPDCSSPVQRIAHADNETNYCAVCQNEGRLLSDRSLARLMHDDWPRTLAELEELRERHKGPR